MFSRGLRLRATAAAPIFNRGFRSSVANFVQAGDKVPSVEVFEGAPSNSLNLAKETSSGKYLIVGVPGAFSPGCSARHVPGYYKNFKEFSAKGFNGVFVIAVNDAFVTGEWAKTLEAAYSPNSAIRFVADHSGEFSKEWDTLFDASKFFGNSRTKRYAAIVEDGVVKAAFVEPDSTGISVSEAESILGTL
ncbi:Ahp1p [Sugiyamaella lignohabitans]|uniref:Ahp1p n=1 Tax=Sugiyamaella lignohabitans TaxID=796027 RepID=A0A161HN08_9ASCO|nr:Ahp1p [Sugiyamaella lignohabitans]ANB15417.1 Ahp1p [Sugiyamaella lignohabitans]